MAMSQDAYHSYTNTHEPDPYLNRKPKFITGQLPYNLTDREIHLRTYRTQKVRGITTIRGCRPFDAYNLPIGSLVNYGLCIWPYAKAYALPAFARPCPTVPRHGFVDSRLVSTQAEAEQIIDETLRADPNGEVIFMPRLTGMWSGIATHAGVTFGLANDGATAGKSAVNVPAYVTSERFKAIVGYKLCEGSTVKGSPFLEFVEDGNRPVFVQLRDGPEVPRSANYIPERTTVQTVVYADPTMDLLAWEAEIAKYAGKVGVVVHHPGGALTSHFSVHAICSRIPVILDKKAPQVGEVLEPAGWEPAKLTKRDYRKLADWLARRLVNGFVSVANEGAALNSIATLHTSPQWGNDSHLLRLRAEGFAAALMYTSAACIGEDRHWYVVGPGNTGESDEMDRPIRPRMSDTQEPLCQCSSCRASASKKNYEIDLKCYKKKKARYAAWKNPADRPRPSCEALAELAPKQSINRSSVYERALQESARKVHRWVKQAAEDLKHPGWQGGYGGSGWAEAAELAADGFETAQAFLKAPTEKNWLKCMAAYNKIIHATHNNGNILNKWVSQRVMTAIASAPGPAFINTFTARVVTGLDQLPAIILPKKRYTVQILDQQQAA